MENPVFIVGSGRSGTTMLRLMLDRHPDMAIPGESHFIPEIWASRRRYMSGDLLDAQRLARHILSTEAVKWWNIPEEAVWQRLRLIENPGFADVVETIYLVYAEREGKRRWGDKTPNYVLSIPLIARLFPAARFIHLVRDGRDVALSFLSIPTGPDNIWQAARRWRRYVGAGRAAGRALAPDRYLEVRYEDLVSRPEGELGRVCAFLDLRFDSIMLNPGESTLLKIQPSWRFIHSRVVLPPTVGVRDWRRDMTLADRMAFETVAGDTLTEFGYERQISAIPFSYRVRGHLRMQALNLYEEASRAKKAMQRVLSQKTFVLMPGSVPTSANRLPKANI